MAADRYFKGDMPIDTGIGSSMKGWSGGLHKDCACEFAREESISNEVEMDLGNPLNTRSNLDRSRPSFPILPIWYVEHIFPV